MDESASEPGLPLRGVRIVELATNIAGPLATLILAEQGADVVKVEPLDGDPLRLVGTRKGSTSAFFASASRGKRSLALDLKAPQACEIVKRLAKDADVILNNYRPGVMERLGLSFDELSKQNPGLIYVDVTGFGQSGPLAQLPAYDNIMQAISGYTDVQGYGGEREFMKTFVCDKITAYTAAQAITAALFARSNTGLGQYLDISMMASSLYFLWPDGMANHTFLSEDVTRLPPITSFLQKFPTRDGEVVVTAVSDEHWKTIFSYLGRDDLITDPRFCNRVARADNLSQLFATLADGLQSVTTRDVVDHLQARDICCVALQSIDDAIAEPHVQALGFVRQRDHPTLGPLNLAMPPARFHGKPSPAGSDCPLVGQHTEELLRDAGFGPEEIRDLAEHGVVSGTDRS